MNMTTWLNEQARLVRGALLAGNLGEARNALRFVFVDRGVYGGMRPALVIRMALYPMSREELGRVLSTLARQAESVFTAGDDLDAEIRTDLAIAARAAGFQRRWPLRGGPRGSGGLTA